MNPTLTRSGDAKVELLASTPLFAGLSPGELHELAALADELTLAAGTPLMVEGRRGHETFVLVDGAAEVRRNGRVVDSLGPGDLVGELAVLGGGVRTATVVTAERTRLLVFTGRDFREIVRRIPALSAALLPTVAERVSAVVRDDARAPSGARRARGT